MRNFSLGLLVGLSLLTGVFAATSSLVKLDKAPVDVFDKDRLLKGAEHFKEKCLTCHSLKYLRYDEITKQAGITLENMPKWDQSAWGGHPPPDLSLVAKRRGADWIYTFLRSYYVDNNRPTGANNLVWVNTGMPNPFMSLQGRQELKMNLADLVDDPGYYRWSQALVLVHPGMMTGEEFDQYTDDIVTYLVYASDPSYIERFQYGPWVLGYLVILLFVVAMLNLNYWDEVKRKYYKEK